MKFNSTYELLVYLRQESLLTSFVYEEYRTSTQLTLLDHDQHEPLFLTPAIENQLYDQLFDYCSIHADGAFNFYGHDLFFDAENKLRFKVEKHVNAGLSLSCQLEEFVSKKELSDIFSKFTYGEKNYITIEDGGLKYSYTQFEVIDADYFDDEVAYEVNLN